LSNITERPKSIYELVLLELNMPLTPPGSQNVLVLGVQNKVQGLFIVIGQK